MNFYFVLSQFGTLNCIQDKGVQREVEFEKIGLNIWPEGQKLNIKVY